SVTRRWSRVLLIFDALGAKDIGEPVIAFMARVLVNRAGYLPEWNGRRPGSSPRMGVVNGKTIVDCVRVDAREALDHVKAAGGIPELNLVVEVRGLDDERVAFPVAAGIAAPHPDLLAHMGTRAVEGDKPGRVNHLIAHDHIARSLHDVEVGVVPGRRHRRAVVAPGDAALAKRPGFVAVG